MHIKLYSRLKFTFALFVLISLAFLPLNGLAATSCINVTSFNPTIGAWWVSGAFTLKNTCSTSQSVGGTQLTLSATQALNATNFSLNSVSYPTWASTTAAAAQNGNSIIITLNTTASLPAQGQASGSFGYNPNGVTLTNLALSGYGSSTTVTPPSDTGSGSTSGGSTSGGGSSTGTTPPASASTGTLYYHAFVPQTSTSEFGNSMNLSGGTYDDLIMSNYIAGVLLGHMIVESFPNMQFNKDYMYGTIFAQLLQENIATELYTPSSNLLAPSNIQSAVMGVGQGGPYQINSYAYDMVGNPAPYGYSLVNYIAIQKNIGFTIAQQADQVKKATPDQFNNKYYGPVLTAYFHLNDLRALDALENGSQGYVSSAAPNFVKCMKNLTAMSNNPLEILVNYAYNQGFYGGLLGGATTDCVNSTSSAFLAKYNSYNNAAGSSYNQYPYQVRFYLDELYNQSSLLPATNNHVAFNMGTLGKVFSKVFQTLAYVNSSGQYVYISDAQASQAFNSALTATHLASGDNLDLSNATQRASIYAVLETATTNLESTLKTNFSATTTNDLTATGGGSTNSGGSTSGGTTSSTPTCPAIVLYPSGLGTYTGGTIVKASNGYFYQCISTQVAPWCNSPRSDYYAPGTGYAWDSAWVLYNCKQ